MDKVSKVIRSKTMSAIRSVDTKMELKYRKELSARGIRYRKNVSSMHGKPDLVFKRKKVVLFLDSCFWHACPKHFRMPKSNKAYWNSKIARNKKRDAEVNKFYRKEEWKTFRFWEHDLQNPIKLDKNLKLLLQAVSQKNEGRNFGPSLS